MINNQVQDYADVGSAPRIISSIINWAFFIAVINLIDTATFTAAGIFLFFALPIAQIIIYMDTGKTLGKLIIGIAVIDKNGNKPSKLKLLAHLLLGFLMPLPNLLLSGNKQNLHDKILGARVVYTREQPKMKSSVRIRASLIDVTAPFLVITAFFIAYTVLLLLYVAAGVISLGYFWVLLDDVLSTVLGYLYIFAIISVVSLFIAQIILYFYKNTSIGKWIFKLTIVDSSTGELASTKQLIKRGLINNWITKVTLIYPILCHILHKKNGVYPHDDFAKTKVVCTKSDINPSNIDWKQKLKFWRG